ncbi:hypothetical protein [Sphingomonas sp. 3-13AW]|jgi:hypothetical protein|uniref:hypothetical protein n=1 Tax=Sphingomonas sp. 3-13AW TaxID=3050450 RepID=UPI003BB70863
MAEQYSEIVRDIGQKCGDDASGAIRRNMALMDTHHEMAQVAVFGAGSALGTAAGAMAASLRGDSDTPINSVEVADHLWTILRPAVLAGLQRIESSQHG